MSAGILNTALLAVSFLILFAAAELLYHKANVRVEFTRKLVHTGTGFLTLLFPLLLADHRLVLFLCLSFAGILLLSLRYKLLPSINAIERKSYGSILYPVSVYLCYLVYEWNAFQYYYFYLPILILAICDPLAALCGKKWPLGAYKAGNGYKTLTGSAVFFIGAFITGIIILKIGCNGDLSLSKTGARIFAVAIITTVTEALSRNGFDNLTVPVAALSVLIITGSY